MSFCLRNFKGQTSIALAPIGGTMTCYYPRHEGHVIFHLDFIWKPFTATSFQSFTLGVWAYRQGVAKHSLADTTLRIEQHGRAAQHVRFKTKWYCTTPATRENPPWIPATLAFIPPFLSPKTRAATALAHHCPSTTPLAPPASPPMATPPPLNQPMS